MICLEFFASFIDAEVGQSMKVVHVFACERDVHKQESPTP